mmetsp:Transcript_4748/g.12009  ORF Transcript_4748/g.12009 Transcript_4748/m.12009 type:complete len:211 (-) Transcript_4748:34-666(-)
MSCESLSVRPPHILKHTASSASLSASAFERLPMSRRYALWITPSTNSSTTSPRTMPSIAARFSLLASAIRSSVRRFFSRRAARSPAVSSHAGMVRDSVEALSDLICALSAFPDAPCGGSAASSVFPTEPSPPSSPAGGCLSRGSRMFRISFSSGGCISIVLTGALIVTDLFDFTEPGALKLELWCTIMLPSRADLSRPAMAAPPHSSAPA